MNGVLGEDKKKIAMEFWGHYAYELTPVKLTCDCRNCAIACCIARLSIALNVDIRVHTPKAFIFTTHSLVGNQ